MYNLLKSSASTNIKLNGSKWNSSTNTIDILNENNIYLDNINKPVIFQSVNKMEKKNECILYFSMISTLLYP